jgi:23S rRNA pseudouridine1911/1915/1917 synthase
VILVAKDQAAFADLRRQFRQDLVQKKYWALVWGDAPREGSIDYPLAHDSKDRRKMKPVGDPAESFSGKLWPALTRYRTVGQLKGFSLVEVEMITGVTHQIRVHLAAIGCPLVGDSLYGADSALSFPVKRHFLHAFYLRCRHPRTGAPMSWESPLPEDLRRVLQAVEITF